MKPRIADATGWELFEEAGEEVRIEYPVGIAHGVDTQSEKRFSYVTTGVALTHWYRVTAPNVRDKYFYGDRALQDARRYAYDTARSIDNSSWMAYPR